jgi:hypothetical protein
MKKLSIVLCCALWLLSSIGVTDRVIAMERKAHGIQWTSDLEHALSQARIEDKPVLLYFFNPT